MLFDTELDLLPGLLAPGTDAAHGTTAPVASALDAGPEALAFILGDDGADLAEGSDGADTMLGGAGADTLSARGGADIVYGNADADLVYGNLGDDTLYGGRGDDTLYGGQGADVLSGGVGDDVLFGNAGDDILLGGAGNDTLAGGAGSDVFVFDPAAGFGADVVSDFDLSADRLQVAGDVVVTAGSDGAVLTVAGQTLTLTGIAAAQVTSSLFLGGNTVTLSTGSVDGGDFVFE